MEKKVEKVEKFIKYLWLVKLKMLVECENKLNIYKNPLIICTLIQT